MIDPTWSAPVGHGKVHVPRCLYSFPTMPDGLARTSASELTRFMMAWIRGGALGDVRILRADTVRQVLSDQRAQSTEHNVIQGLVPGAGYLGTPRRRSGSLG